MLDEDTAADIASSGLNASAATAPGISSGLNASAATASGLIASAAKEAVKSANLRSSGKKEDLGIMSMESRGSQKCNITIDSGAADSVIPQDMLASEFPLLPKQEGVRSIAANGNVIGNYGRRNIAFKTQGRSGLNCVTFHVADVKKPLASVSKMVEKGSSVHFTPQGSYILGPKGERIELQQKGGVYVMDVKFMTGFSGQV